MRETRVEAHLNKRVREAGGFTTKIPPTASGAPDRMVILPGGLVELVETKTPGGRVRPIQKVWHDRARARGVKVYVLSTLEEVDQWITSLLPDE